MYTEEPRKNINWGNLIKKGIIIIIVAAIILLVIWLFTRNNQEPTDINVNYDGNTNVNENIDNGTIKDTNTYSEIFIDNYRYFHDTAKEYFLISNLPKEGETLKYTLQELIDKKLILSFGYTDKENCDTEASYVTVKKVDGKYTMTTTLVCGREVATTTEELGCNQICEENINCDCDCDATPDTNTVPEYEYKQAYKTTETVYTCPTGYTKVGSGSNTSCVKSDSISSKATKTITYNCLAGYTKVGTGENTTCVKSNTSSTKATKTVTYSCPDGYKKAGSNENTVCVKGTETTIDATKTVTYTCPDGYTKSGSGENTKCSKTNETTMKPTETYSYSCPSGYTKSGNGANTTCIGSSMSIFAESTTTYTCPSGYTQSGSGANTKCTKTTPTTIDAPYTLEYRCSTGTLTSDNRCKTTTSSTTIAATPNISYKCPSGYDQSGNSCIKYLYTSISYGSSYKGCTGGQLVNSPCTSGNCTTSRYVYKCTEGVNKVTEYKCPSGYTPSGSGANTKCTKPGTTTYTKATLYRIYKCTEGKLTSDKKCIINNTTTTAPIANKNYYCSTGTLVGTTCLVPYKTTSAIKTTEYSCPSGYDKTGSGVNTTCVKPNETSINATKTDTYSCKDGYAQLGDKCVKTNESTIKATKNTTYSCPSGYTKSGSGENTTCSINGEDKVKAYKVTNYTCQSGYTRLGVGSNSVCTKGTTTTKSPSKKTQEVTKYRYKWSTETSLAGWEKTGNTRQAVVISKETSSNK